MTRRIAVACIALMAVSCSPFLGLQLSPYEECFEIYESGRHVARLKHLIFDYEYTVDPEKQTITLEGSVVGNSATESSLWSLMEVSVIVLFLNDKKKVVDVQYFHLWPGKNIMEPEHFERTFHYLPEYRCLLLTYRAQAREGSWL